MPTTSTQGMEKCVEKAKQVAQGNAGIQRWLTQVVTVCGILSMCYDPEAGHVSNTGDAQAYPPLLNQPCPKVPTIHFQSMCKALTRTHTKAVS